MQRAELSDLCDHAQMDDARSRTRLLIEAYLTETCLDASGLARLAQIAPSTLLRFLNDPAYTSIPTTRTMEKLARAIALWRSQGGLSSPRANPARTEQIGRFVQDAEQLAWLRLWDEMSPTDRRRAALILRALAADVSKFG